MSHRSRSEHRQEGKHVLSFSGKEPAFHNFRAGSLITASTEQSLSPAETVLERNVADLKRTT
jgi:hypothetical protein